MEKKSGSLINKSFQILGLEGLIKKIKMTTVIGKVKITIRFKHVISIVFYERFSKSLIKQRGQPKIK